MDKRRGCFVLVAFLVAGLVVAGGLYAVQFVPLLIPEKTGNQMLRQWVSRNTNAILETGWIAPIAFPSPGIRIKNIELKLPGRKGEPAEFFRAESVKVAANGWELLVHQRVEWKKITLIKPEIVIVREPDGKINAARWAKDMPLKNRPPAPPEDSFVKWMIKDAIKKALPADKNEWASLFALSSFEIKDGRVRAYDRARGKKALLAPVDLGDVDFTFSGKSIKEPVHFELSFPFPQGEGLKPDAKMRFQGTLEVGEDLERPSVRVVSLSGGWQGISVNSLTGRASLKPEPSFEAKINATTDYSSFYRVVTWPPVAHSKTLPFTSGSGRLNVQARVWGPAPDKVSKIHYRGKAEIMDMDWDPGRVVSGITGINTTARLNDGVLTTPWMNVKVGGNKVRGKARILEREYPKFIINLESDYVDLAEFFVGRKLRKRYGDKLLPMRTEWEGRVRLGEGVYKKMRIRDVRGQWEVPKSRVLTFPELRFKSCGGTYVESGRSYVDFNHLTTYKFRFDGRIRDMDITTFVDQVFDATIFLHGDMRGDGYITGAFVSGEFVTRRLDGRLAITATDGYFEGYNPVGAIFRYLGAEVPEPLRGLQYDRMTANVEIKNGVGYTEDLVVTAPGMLAEVMGWIDFHSKHCNLKIKISFFGELADIIKSMPVVGEPMAYVGENTVALYIRAYDHWDRLKYAPWAPMNDDPPPLPEAAGREKPDKK
ncbi:MAG: AsmA-like C-terminal region-containing protein [bacterium]